MVQVLQIHAGELLPPSTFEAPIMIVGTTDPMYVRVSINQFDAPYYRSDAPAVAYLQGDRHVEFPLHFVQLEPLLVSKQNLTNTITEKVDTQVLQAIYKIEKSDQPLFIGQQMDVYIKTEFPRENAHE